MNPDPILAERPAYERWKRGLAARGPLVMVVSLIGFALFARSLYSLGSEQIVAGLLGVGWGFGLIVLVAGAREALRALAWTHTIDGEARLGFVTAFRARLVGEAFSALLPMGILVGEPAKAVQVRRVVPFPAAFAGLALEFFFYSLSLLPLLTAGVIALVFTDVLQDYVRWLYVAPPTIGLLAVGGAGTLAALRRAPALVVSRARGAEHLLSKMQRTVERARAALAGVARRPVRQLMGVFGLELAFQMLAVAEVYITLYLISPVPPTIASAIVLEAVGRIVTMAFKYLPMRIGVDEAGAAWFASLLHLGSHTGITLAVVRKLRLLFWSGVGLALLGRERSTTWLPA